MRRYWTRKARIDIVPLIDVMVTLVFFFLVFGSISDRPAGLPVNLPSARTAPAAESPRLTVALDATGVYEVEGRAVPPAQVPSLIAAALAKSPDLQVVLCPDRTVTYDRVVAALDLISSGGASRPALGVKRDLPEPAKTR